MIAPFPAQDTTWLARRGFLFGLVKKVAKSCAFRGKHQNKAEAKGIARNPANRRSFDRDGLGLRRQMDEGLKFESFCEVDFGFGPTAGR